MPGSVTVEVHEPTELTIFNEDPIARGGFIVQTGGSSTLSPSPVHVAVSGPSGESVAAVPYERDLLVADNSARRPGQCRPGRAGPARAVIERGS